MTNERLNRAPCGFLSLDDNGVILYLNDTLGRLLGLYSQDVFGQHVDTILTAGARIYYQTHVFPLLRMRGVVEEVYLSLLTAAGEPLPVLLNGSRTKDEGQVVIDLAVIPIRRRSQFEDELLQAKRAAEEADRSKERFLHMMSHDLQTPLTAIKMTAEMLASGLGGAVTELQRQELGRIEEASSYVLQLVRDILAFARLNSGKIQLPVDEIVLADVLSRTESLVSHLVEEAGVIFLLETPAADLKVKAVDDRLQQILLNLISNAIKYTEPGGQVRVSTMLLNNKVLLSVEDTGRGIPAEQLENIFQPFVQIKTVGGVDKPGSVGLGLAISREIARAMHGDLTAESEYNKGSKFTITLQAATSV